MRKKRKLAGLILVAILTVVIASCPARGAALKQRPILTSIDPVTTVAGAPSVALVLTGSNFSPTSLVQWNGLFLSLTCFAMTRICATVPGSELTVVGTFSVRVFTPGKFGGTSAARTFTVTAYVPPPASGLTIVTTFISPATKDIYYETGFQADGGQKPYAWSASGLPPGLVMTTAEGFATIGGTPPTTEAVQEGKIYGTPTLAGPYDFTISVTDAAMAVVHRTIQLVAISTRQGCPRRVEP